MNRRDVFAPDPRACVHAWCATEHGRTVHADDEDHRSAGIGVTVRVRTARERGGGRLREWELGLLRRSTDDETWLVVEMPGGASIELPRDAVRVLLDAVAADPDLRAFCLGDGSGP